MSSTNQVTLALIWKTLRITSLLHISAYIHSCPFFTWQRLEDYYKVLDCWTYFPLLSKFWYVWLSFFFFLRKKIVSKYNLYLLKKKFILLNEITIYLRQVVAHFYFMSATPPSLWSSRISSIFCGIWWW